MRRRALGFTLVELMASLVIGAMIVTATAAMYATTLDGWQRANVVNARWKAAQAIGDLIERHLRDAISPAMDRQAVFVGQDLSLEDGAPGHRLTFISSAPGRFPRNQPVGDACEVDFELDPSGENGMTLRLQCPPDGKPGEGGYYTRLSPLVRGFRVIYFDGTQWLTQWTASCLPKAVEFTLLIDRDVDPEEAQERADKGESAPETNSAVAAAGATGPIAYSRLVWLPAAEAEGAAQGGGGGASAGTGASTSPGGGMAGGGSR